MPIEIAVCSTGLAGQIAKLLVDSRNSALPIPSRQEILQALLIPKDEAARLADIGVQDGWLIFAFAKPGTDEYCGAAVD